MSWTPLEKLKERDSEEAMVTKVLRAHQVVGPAVGRVGAPQPPQDALEPAAAALGFERLIESGVGQPLVLHAIALHGHRAVSRVVPNGARR